MSDNRDRTGDDHGPSGGYSGMNNHLKKYLANHPKHGAVQRKFVAEFTRTKKKKLVRRKKPCK